MTHNNKAKEKKRKREKEKQITVVVKIEPKIKIARSGFSKRIERTNAKERDGKRKQEKRKRRIPKRIQESINRFTSLFSIYIE